MSIQWKNIDRPQYAKIGNRRVRTLSGMGGSRDGSRVRRYSGRGGRVEKSSIIDAVTFLTVIERSKEVLLTRHAAGVGLGPSRPGVTRAQWELSSEIDVVAIESCIVIFPMVKVAKTA